MNQQEHKANADFFLGALSGVILASVPFFIYLIAIAIANHRPCPECLPANAQPVMLDPTP